MKQINVNKLMPFAAELLTALFLLLFVYTGISKLSDWEKFRAVLRESALIAPLADALTWLIPIVEFLLAGCLFFPSKRHHGFIGTTVLMSLFTGYIAYMLLTQSKLPCSCGGIINNLSWPQHLLMNAALTCCAIAGIFFTSKHNVFIAINRGS